MYESVQISVEHSLFSLNVLQEREKKMAKSNQKLQEEFRETKDNCIN